MPAPTPEDHVWVIDQRTGHGYPLRRNVAEADPKTFRVDESHPVRDRHGYLLATKFRTEKGGTPAQAARGYKGIKKAELRKLVDERNADRDDATRIEPEADTVAALTAALEADDTAAPDNDSADTGGDLVASTSGAASTTPTSGATAGTTAGSAGTTTASTGTSAGATT